jgi:hypothetical protein
MSEITDNQSPQSEASPPPPRSLRLPSARASLALATVMLALGVALGAAIGPAPDASFASSADGIAQRLPQLIALLASRAQPASAPPTSAPVSPPAVRPQATPKGTSTATAPSPAATAATTTPSATTPSPSEEESTPPSSGGAKKPKLPAITNVWLIELDGAGFTEAKAQAAAAPYITGMLIPASTLLSGWSALSASAFASEAALAEPPAAGATPPLLHSIVQPPCPEGAAAAACAPGTPGQLTAADEFLKATLATITGTPSYREHGLIVVTFATVAIASQSGLPASASNATLTYQPPVGVALLSPFAKPGPSTTPFNPTSPRQSLEKLLH